MPDLAFCGADLASSSSTIPSLGLKWRQLRPCFQNELRSLCASTQPTTTDEDKSPESRVYHLVLEIHHSQLLTKEQAKRVSLCQCARIYPVRKPMCSFREGEREPAEIDADNRQPDKR